MAKQMRFAVLLVIDLDSSDAVHLTLKQVDEVGDRVIVLGAVAQEDDGVVGSSESDVTTYIEGDAVLTDVCP